jgi:lipopolysaccharide export system protein LptC
MISSKQLSYWLLLLAGVLLSSYLLFAQHKDAHAVKQDSRYPDLIMEDVVGTRMDSNGFPKSRLYTPKVMRFSSKEILDFVKPHLIFYSQTEAPWHLYALHGQSKENFTTLLFWDNVKLQQTPTNKPDVIITTSTLTVYPKKDLAITDQPVTLTSGQSNAQALGVRANLKTEEVELLSKARGVYAPKS